MGAKRIPTTQILEGTQPSGKRITIGVIRVIYFRKEIRLKIKSLEKMTPPQKKKTNNAVLIFQKGIVVERGEEN